MRRNFSYELKTSAPLSSVRFIRQQWDIIGDNATWQTYCKPDGVHLSEEGLRIVSETIMALNWPEST